METCTRLRDAAPKLAGAIKFYNTFGPSVSREGFWSSEQQMFTEHLLSGGLCTKGLM